MSRVTLPYQAPDVSALARLLKREIHAREDKPGHVELLNILAKAAGYRNFQHLKASDAARDRLAAPQPEPEAVDFRRVEDAARCFGADGVLTRWPARTVIQQLCLWRLWARFPADRALSEREVNEILMAAHAFGDHVLLRREMFNQKLLDRTADCRVYRRIERRPPPEALALIRGARTPATKTPAAG